MNQFKSKPVKSSVQMNAVGDAPTIEATKLKVRTNIQAGFIPIQRRS